MLPDGIDHPLEVLRIESSVEHDQTEQLARRRAARSQEAVDGALRQLRLAAQTDANLVPVILDAARAEATLGEICDTLRELWGVYVEVARY
ncbi:MAG: hypothetical protein NVSMB65_22330 [Chloroflexota bacterium]